MKPFLCLLLVFSLSAFAQKGPPRIACDVPTFEYGSRDISEHVIHTFVIKNTGQSPLNIARVKPACGCTLAEISTKLVPPGGTSLITADLDLSKGKPGVQNKSMTVYSDDPTQPTLQLSLRGTATSTLMITPTIVQLGELEVGQVVTKQIKVTNSGTKPITVKSAVAQNNLMVCEIQTIREGFDYTINISNSKSLPPGRVSDFITVTTDAEKSPTTRITVSGNVLDKLTITPQTFDLPISTSGEKINRAINVGPGTVKTFKVLSAEWPGSGATFKVTPIGARGFSVLIQNIDVRTELNGSEIIIKTDVEDFEEIRIPVNVNSTPK